MANSPQITDWIIDCDTHITEPAGVWSDRLPAKWRDVGPRMIRTDEGYDAWLVGEGGRPVPIGFTAIAGWDKPFPDVPKTMADIPAAAYDAQARLDYMDSVGIWAMALYPNVGGFGSQSFLRLGDPELMLACVRAYNDWLIEWCAPDPRRFIPIMAMPFWDIDATVAEVERGAAMGHKGILFSGEPQTMGQPLLGDKHWDPLYRVAAETELSINFHIGSGDNSAAFSPTRVATDGPGSAFVNSSIDLFLGNALQVTDLLLSGVLPRHPDTRFVSVESGIGWIPFVLEAADYGFGNSSMPTDAPEYEKLPSEYFRRQVSACAFFEEHALRHSLEIIGAENVLFETDYPHPVCLYGNVREKIDAAFGDIDEYSRRRILWDNAAELYKVGAPDRKWRP
jgi:predicted TIM-barrel fold metal-dependent hydrolase